MTTTNLKKENVLVANVAWAEGWDEFEIDLFSVRNLTAEEVERVSKHPYLLTVDPFGHWVWCGHFSHLKVGDETMAVRMTQHLRGGS